MGRTVATFRQLIEEAAQHWSKFRRALRREDQEFFDRLFRHARCYTQAATYQCHDNPMESILLSIALDQEKRLHALERLVQPGESHHATLRGGRSPEPSGLRPYEQLVQDGEDRDADPGMDLRPLPQPAGDDTVADRGEPEAPPPD